MTRPARSARRSTCRCPGGFVSPLYDALGDPVELAERPGQSGPWIAYELVRPATATTRDEAHAFLYHAGDAQATDLGAIPSISADLRLAAAPDGSL